MDNLCFSSYQLLQTMSNIYGSDPAYEMFLKLEEVLGPEVKSNLFLKMLDSSYANPILNFRFNNNHCINVINIIKAVRQYAVDKNHNKFGLKDAKDIVDDARFKGRGTLYFLHAQERNEFINELKLNNGQII